MIYLWVIGTNLITFGATLLVCMFIHREKK